MDAELFELAIEAAVTLEREQGIGTLSEGVLHGAVKYYYQPDDGLHEISIGEYVCDAITESRTLGRTVIEVQTANFRNLKKKLAYFLSDEPENDTEHSEKTAKDAVNPHKNVDTVPLSALSDTHKSEFPGQVTVVYPLESSKRIVWIDPDTGESTVGRRSPIGFVPARCLRELYQLKDFVGHKGFRFIILGIEVKDEKLLCGRSRDRKKFGARRIARIPEKLTHELVFEELSDYAELIPEQLGNTFTAAEFRKAAKMSEKRASYSLGTLLAIGILTRKKHGRAYEYTRVFPKKSSII